MKINPHQINNTAIAEVVAEKLLVSGPQDALELFMDLYYQGYDTIALYAVNITSSFFDLSTGIAGEVLQKVSTYRIRLFIIGVDAAKASKSLTEFMFESNKYKQVNFVPSFEEVKKRIS